LTDIHRTRQHHANQQQQQFQNQQAAQMAITQQQMQAQQLAQNQNQFQQGFGMPQLQQTGQAVPNPMQQQFPQQQRLGNPNSMPPQQQKFQNGQIVQGMPRPVPQNGGQPQFTQQEHQYILNMARQMASNLSDQDKQGLQAQVRNLSPQQLQNMQAQAHTPVEYIIRNHATRKYLEERSKRQQQSGQGPAPSSTNQGHPASQVTVRSQSQQPPPASVPQHADPTFTSGNMDQFLGQQAEALRHQEAGQVVVPASHGQGAPPQVRGTSHPQQQQQGQFGANRASQPQNNLQPQVQPFWNTPQPPQQNLQQPPPMQAQPPTPSFTNMPPQPPQQHALQGQVGGLSTNQGQRTPQQIHNMPTLNQPLDLSVQKQKDQAQRTAKPTPKPTQRSAPNASSGPQPATASAQPNSGQQKTQSGFGQGQWNSLPANVRTKLLSMPEDQRKPWLQQMLQKQQQARLQTAGNANDDVKPDNAVQSIPQVALPMVKGGQGGSAQVSSTPVANAPQPPVMGPSNIQFQGAQQPPELGEGRPAQPKMVPIKLTNEQGQYMDNLSFPPNIINRRSELGNVPENVQSWRQLKEFVHRNAQNLPPSSLQKVIGLQSIHFQMQNSAHQQRLQMNQQGQQPNPQFPPAGVAPVGQMVPPQGNQGNRQAPQVQDQFGIPNLPEPTAQDLQGARNTLPPHMRHIRDDQLGQMIQAKRQQDFLKTPQGQQALAMHQQRNNMIRAQRPDAQATQFPAGLPDPGQMQRPVRALNQPQQAGQQRPPQQQPPRPNTQPPKAAPGAWPGVRPDPSPANQKGIKRNNTDDVIEVPDPKLAQQTRPHLPDPKEPHPPPTVNGMPRITPEQFARLNNEQKTQLQLRMQAFQAAHQQRAALQQIGVNTPPTRAANTANQNAAPNVRNPRLHQLMDEVAQSTPPRQIIPMSPQTRTTMVEKLRESTGAMIARFEQSIPIFLQNTNDESQVKDLLRIVSSSLVSYEMMLTRLSDCIFVNRFRIRSSPNLSIILP